MFLTIVQWFFVLCGISFLFRLVPSCQAVLNLFSALWCDFSATRNNILLCMRLLSRHLICTQRTFILWKSFSFRLDLETAAFARIRAVCGNPFFLLKPISFFLPCHKVSIFRQLYARFQFFPGKNFPHKFSLQSASSPELTRFRFLYKFIFNYFYPFSLSNRLFCQPNTYRSNNCRIG